MNLLRLQCIEFSFEPLDGRFQPGKLNLFDGISDVDCSDYRTETKANREMALALLTANHPEQAAFRTYRVYDLYSQITEREDADPLSEDRVYRLLKEQAFLGVTESNHTGGGQGEGSYLEHRLLRDPEIVVRASNVLSRCESSLVVGCGDGRSGRDAPDTECIL